MKEKKWKNGYGRYVTKCRRGKNGQRMERKISSANKKKGRKERGEGL